MNWKGQVSLEYILILAGFFAVFAAILPSVSNSVNAFGYAQDTILAEQISERIGEQAMLFKLLGDGSTKKLEFIPTKQIYLWSKEDRLIISAGEKQFESNIFFPQNLQKQEFSEKFVIEIKKEDGKTIVGAYPV